MREIKFKAVMQRHDETMYVSESYSIDSGLSYLFDFENNRWDRFLEMITTEERFVKLFPDDDEYLNGWSHIENIQYTGLKDKNGVEIYEGDIVKKRNGNYKLGKVAFDFGMFCFKSIGCGICANSDIFEDIHSLHYVEFDEINNYEVIGNIYENPELLKSTP